MRTYLWKSLSRYPSMPYTFLHEVSFQEPWQSGSCPSWSTRVISSKKAGRCYGFARTPLLKPRIWNSANYSLSALSESVSSSWWWKFCVFSRALLLARSDSTSHSAMSSGCPWQVWTEHPSLCIYWFNTMLWVKQATQCCQPFLFLFLNSCWYFMPQEKKSQGQCHTFLLGQRHSLSNVCLFSMGLAWPWGGASHPQCRILRHCYSSVPRGFGVWWLSYYWKEKDEPCHAEHIMWKFEHLPDALFKSLMRPHYVCSWGKNRLRFTNFVSSSKGC